MERIMKQKTNLNIDDSSNPASFSISFEDLVSGQAMSRERLNGLLEGLNDFGDEITQMVCLQTVCDFLSLATEGNFYFYFYVYFLFKQF
jgi:uncharacterized protein YaaR (DUF327 family)